MEATSGDRYTRLQPRLFHTEQTRLKPRVSQVKKRGNRMQAKLAVAIAGAGLLLAAAPLGAHHAFYAEFDETKPITLKGTVTKWEMVNPHSWIHLDVKGPDGKVVSWMIEGGSPNALLRLGFTKDSLPPGTEIVVEGYQAKGGAIRAVGKDLTFTDGKRLFMGGSAPGATPGESTESPAAAPAKK
jgi:hypothetical protein